jgi:hypothetical protein
MYQAASYDNEAAQCGGILPSRNGKAACQGPPPNVRARRQGASPRFPDSMTWLPLPTVLPACVPLWHTCTPSVFC